MNAETLAARRLAEMNIAYSACTLIRKKAGISLYRVISDDKRFVLKVFENAADTREIANYLLLQKLGVCTLPLLGHTADSILLPDVNASAKYRLGIEADLGDLKVAKAIAKWYRELHTKGAACVADSMYDETDLLTLENMARVAEKTGTVQAPLWPYFERHFDGIRRKVSALPRTLTYNDFYYTNLITAKDMSGAFMFDYNLLGKGIAYGDVRNVTSSLSEEAAAVFRNEYGMTGLEEQETADNAISPLVALHFACARDSGFPAWAGESLEKLNSGEILDCLRRWIGR